ncbi:MAG: type II toxin-antitoxin system death-on-curing family toxin [Candidatus Lokiarchaeota archaeon]|nr:type II toxin-antitoxin system death-on-curing family toxin [Candidatus Lokiarchaeota archaeon]
MTWIPTVEYVEELFKDQIKGGQLMNRQGLMSTLDKVRWGIPFSDAPTIWDQATILYKDIIEGHYFSDGNKRIASLLVYIFLYKNGYKFSPAEGDIYKTTLDTAQGLLSFEAIKEWFKTHSNKVNNH